VLPLLVVSGSPVCVPSSPVLALAVPEPSVVPSVVPSPLVPSVGTPPLVGVTGFGSPVDDPVVLATPSVVAPGAPSGHAVAMDRSASARVANRG
jgi:hypothetical protein